MTDIAAAPHDTAGRALADVFDGPIHRPGDDGYDAARLPWQRVIDPHPALVAEASGPADVRAALRVARDHELPFAVQATGHGTVAPCDDGLLLTTASMNAVRVDARRRVARADAGASWDDVITTVASHGLAPLSGSSPTVGVTGYTLGGGAGWLSRAYGFAADNLLRAEVVTADGDLLTVDAESRPDLFWALRGGGGGFGVVTSLEFRLFPVTGVYGGMAMFGIDRAAQTLELYRQWAAEEPDESNTAVVVMRMPSSPELPESLRGRPVLGLRAFYLGGAADAERVLAPLREVAGPALMDGMSAMSYADTTTRLIGPPPPPTAAESRMELLRDVPDEVIDTAIAVAEGDGPVSAVEVRHWGGAMARPPENAGPVGHRDVPFSVMLGAPMDDRDQADAVRAGVDEVAAEVRPHTTGGSFLNFLTDPARTATAYTSADYRRLAEVKRAYDPDNVLHVGHTVPPAA